MNRVKNFTKELKDILKEDPGAPILSPDEVIKRANTMVVLTNQAPPKLLALAGSSRRAILLNYKPLMITFPDQRGVFQVEPEDIVFENHQTCRDVTEAGYEETYYEKFFSGAMKKFGVSSPIELNPEDTKKFFNYVDKNWEAEEESDGSKTEILPAIGAVAGGVARGAMALGRGVASAANMAGELADGEEAEDANEAVKRVPYIYWNKASDGKRAKLLQLAKPGISTKWAKVDYESLTPMLKKAIEKVFKTKKDQIEIAPAVAAVAGAAGAGAAGKVMDKLGVGDENESGWEDPPRLGGEPSLITPMEADDNEDVSTGKVGKKDKGSYQHAYKLALKKYKIHSADELDTPAERKGFTAYVDRLWKGGEVKETSADTDEGIKDLGFAAKRKAQQAGKGIKSGAKKLATGAKKAAAGAKKSVAQKAKAKAGAAGSSIKKKAAQMAADRQKASAAREKEREREQAAREKEREQKAKEKDNGNDGSDDEDDDKDDKKKEKGGFGGFLKQAAGAATQAAKQQTAQYTVKTDAAIPEAIKASTMYGVVKGDPKGKGEVVFKGSNKKAEQIVKKLRKSGKAYVINSPSAKVGQIAYHKKGHGLKIEDAPYKPNLSYTDATDPGASLAKQMKKNIGLEKKKVKEVSPPDRKHQVKGIKKHMAQKKGKDKIPKTYIDKKTGKRKKTNPWALAWAQYDKYGVPSRIEKD